MALPPQTPLSSREYWQKNADGTHRDIDLAKDCLYIALRRKTDEQPIFWSQVIVALTAYHDQENGYRRIVIEGD